MPTPHERYFNRPPRIRPNWSPRTLEIPDPPQPPEQADTSAWLAVAMPIVGVVLLGLTMVFVGTGANIWALALPMGVMATLGVVTTVLTTRTQTRRSAADYAARMAFFEERLAAQREIAEAHYAHETSSRLSLDPDPETLLQIASARGADLMPQARLWERRPIDSDFLNLRVGTGNVPSSLAIRRPPPTKDAELDRRLLELSGAFETLRQVPITVPIVELGSLGLAGEHSAVRALLHALIWQAAVLHSPNELRIALVYGQGDAAAWDWLRWLDHSIPFSNDRDQSLRMCAGDGESVPQLLSALLDQLSRRRDLLDRHRDGAPPRFTQFLLIVDDVERVRDMPVISEIMRLGPALKMAVIFRVPRWELVPDQCAAMLELTPHGARWMRASSPWPRDLFKPDAADTNMSDRLARRLAGIQLLETGGNRELPRSVRLFDLLKVKDEQDLNPPRFWDEAMTSAWHADVPIGALNEEEPLYLNLYENQHGPHGIIAGATGAGKSVLLQCIIAALAIKHSPVRLQILLIDFKGGASLAMFQSLPHTAGFVTDLEGRLAERAMTAIKSEIRYRKALLKRTAAELGEKKLENIADYRAAAARHGLPPLPNLLIVIDEFDELVSTYQEFVTELVRVVKQGRSLGVHLLLATQQPAKAVKDEIRTQLKFFIALRLGSSEDSREMLLKPDAAFLPTDIPGRAYFRVGAQSQLFQVAQVTGEYRAAASSATPSPQSKPRVEFRERGPVEPEPVGGERRTSDQRITDLDVLVTQMRLAGQATITRETARTGWQPRPIWQPPLPNRLHLPEVAPDLAAFSGALWATPHRPEVAPDLATLVGKQWATPPVPSAWLRVPIGRLDIPQESRQEPLSFKLAESHLAIIGAPGSGKTMLLRTLLVSLALTHSPQDVWCYLLDAGGQGLTPLAKLPHVGGLVQARERERVRRLFRVLETTIRERQDRFREAEVSDLPGYRVAGGRLPALVVLIDKIAILREEFKDELGDATIIDRLVGIARVGRQYGIHLVVTADRPGDLTYKLFSLLETRVALRMPELHDYSDVLGGRITSQIPATLAGRGLWMLPEQGIVDLQVALPTLDKNDTVAEEGEAVDQATILDSELIADLRDMVGTLHQIWMVRPEADEARPIPVALLPDQIGLVSLGTNVLRRRPMEALVRLPVGRESLQIAVAELTLSAENPHALIVGPRRSGKTVALQTMLLGLTKRYSPSELRLVILDGPRRGLRSLRDLPHVEGYAQSETEVRGLVTTLAELRVEQAGRARWVIALDDYTLSRERMKDQFQRPYSDTPNLFVVLNELAATGGQCGVHLLLAAGIAFADDDLLRTLDAARSGLIMWPGRYDGGTRFLGVSLPLSDQRDAEQPQGRALLVQEDEQRLVQVARVVEADLEQFLTTVS